MKKYLPALLKSIPILLISLSLFTLSYANNPKNTITVTGEAKLNQVNKTATFNAGVSSVKDEKEEAVSEVNEKIKKIVDAIKAFGVDSKYIKTQNASVFRMDQTVYEDGIQKSKPGQWSANNNVEIKLINQDQNKLEEFSNMLTATEATNVNGPYFDSPENSEEIKIQLYKEALKNAEVKAAEIAKSTNRKLGKIVYLTEGTTNSEGPILYNNKASGMGGGGGTTIEPGTNTVKGTLTVVYELKNKYIFY